MTSTGRVVCTNREIVWDADHEKGCSRPLTWCFIVGFGCFVVGGGIFLAERAVCLVLPFAGSGLLVMLPPLATLLWRDRMVFDLVGRRYARWRGFAPRVKRAWEGGLDELAALEIVGRYEERRGPDESHAFNVNLVWKGGSRAPFCFGGATTAAEAAQLAAALAPGLGVAVEERWEEEAG